MISMFKKKQAHGTDSPMHSIRAEVGRLREVAVASMGAAGMFLESAAGEVGGSLIENIEKMQETIVSAGVPSLAFESAADARVSDADYQRPNWAGANQASAEAAAFAVWASSASPKLAMENASRIDQLAPVFAPNTAVIPAVVNDSITISMLPEDMQKAVLSMEAYDQTEAALMNEYSMSFNYDGSYGSLFTETLYPTIAINPNHVGLEVLSKVRVVQDYVTNSTSGAVSNWNRRNILFAYRDHTLLKKNSTTLVPVWRNSNAGKFTDTALLATVARIVDGESIVTSSLRPNVVVNYLGVCQTDAQLAQGQTDSTDSIEPAVALRYLDFKFGDDVVRFTTLDMATSVFVEGRQTQDRVMQLMLSVKNVALTAETLAVTGAALADTELAKIAADNLIVRVNLSGFAEINLRSGEVKLSYAHAEPVGVSKLQSDKSQIDVTASYGALLAKITTGTNAIGYDIQAYSTNSNFRRFGDIVDTVSFKRVYTVPRRSPIIARRPLNADVSVDRDDLQALVATIKARLNNEAVTSLLEQFETLYSRAKAYKRDATDLIPEQFGVGAFYFRPYAERVVDLDLSTVVDSLKSADRMEDLQAALLTVIRQNVYDMYNRAEMDPGLEMLYGAGAKRPEVIIATDQLISKYLMQAGETRTLGPGFDFRVVETIDDRFTNHIFLTFGCFNQGTNQELCPAHWGNTLWVPEVTQSISPRSSNGQVSRETFVTPRYLFVNNLPVATMITLKAGTIKELTHSKIALWTDEK